MRMKSTAENILIQKSFASILLWSRVIPPNNQVPDLVALSGIRD